VNEFLARFAQINVHLMLSDHTINIVDEHIDLAVRVGALPDSTLVATKVGEIRRVVCGSPDYFAAHGVPKTPDDLANHMCVTFTALASGMTWIFNRSRPSSCGASRSSPRLGCASRWRLAFSNRCDATVKE
jgi:DNA-binding transcriptional LysR family regulator